MISDRTYKSIMKHCNFTAEKSSTKCDDAVSYAINHEFGGIDQYSIYTPSCSALTNNSARHIRFGNTLLHRQISGYDPCTENYAEKYYNRPDVQKAMHANTTGIPYEWTACRFYFSFIIYLNSLLKWRGFFSIEKCFFFFFCRWTVMFS